MKNKDCIGLMGSSGRVGLELQKLLESNRTSWISWQDRGQKKSVDVWIDFSSPEGFDLVLKECLASKVPLVSGTTGLSKNQLLKMKKASQKIPILYSRNMSVGIAIMTEAIESFKGSEGFDFQIEEIHHRHKKDSPSGTALHLQEKLDEVTQKRNPSPLAMRGGGVFGIHKVFAFSDSEIISFEHSAMNRKVFAEGALKAAKYLYKKKPGLYSMRDVIKTKVK